MADEFILETHGLTKEFAGFFAVRGIFRPEAAGSGTGFSKTSGEPAGWEKLVMRAGKSRR